MLFIEKWSNAMSTETTKVLGPQAGKAGMLGSIGVRFMVGGAESGGGFSLVEHPMPPRKLAAPLHRHSREDEYSFVLEGKVGALLGGEVVYGQAGDLITGGVIAVVLGLAIGVLAGQGFGGAED